jgi:hypothetical protein
MGFFNIRAFSHNGVKYYFTGPENLLDLFIVVLGLDPDNKEVLDLL